MNNDQIYPTFYFPHSLCVERAEKMLEILDQNLDGEISEDEFIQDIYGGVVFEGYVDTIKHSIQHVSHLDQWQHDLRITMRDSTRDDNP